MHWIQLRTTLEDLPCFINMKTFLALLNFFPLVKNVLYFLLYFAFYRFSGAHNKPTSDSKYDPTVEHQNCLLYKLVRRWEDIEFDENFPNHIPHVAPLCTVPLTEIDDSMVNERLFYSLTANKTRPLVIRGLIKNCNAVKKWNANYFTTNYGETNLLTLARGKHFDKQNAYTSFTHKIDCKYMSIKESLKNMMNESKESFYINNVTEIFMHHPNLISDLNIDCLKKIDDSIDENSWYKVNMFMGGPETGSSLHCAVGGNFFFNIYGKKKWILIDPCYSKYLRSTPSEQFGFAISGYDIEDNRQVAKLNDVIPKYEVILEPGDMLYIPPWWWHYVHNETNFTIGCAVRDHTVYWQSIKNNPTFMLMSPYIYKLNPLFLKVAEWLKGREFLLKKSMESDKYIMHHLAGTS